MTVEQIRMETCPESSKANSLSDGHSEVSLLAIGDNLLLVAHKEQGGNGSRPAHTHTTRQLDLQANPSQYIYIKLSVLRPSLKCVTNSGRLVAISR